MGWAVGGQGLPVLLRSCGGSWLQSPAQPWAQWTLGDLSPDLSVPRPEVEAQEASGLLVWPREEGGTTKGRLEGKETHGRCPSGSW